MNTLFRILLIIVSLGLASCQTPPTVVVPEGPKTTELNNAKDEQINGLTQQVKDEQAARELEQKQAALVGADLDTILFAAEHVEIGLPRTAIEEEAKLGKARSPASNPAEVIKGKDRVIAILQGEVSKAKGLYDQANGEAAQAKTIIAAKDKEINARDGEIKTRDVKIGQLVVEAKKEKMDHLKDVQNRISQLEKERDEAEQKTIMFWLGIGSIILIIGGIALIAISSGRMIVQGSILSVGGGLVILLRLGYLSLVAQPWFPYAAGITAAAILGAIIWAVYHMWVAHKLDEKKSQAIQDLRDEAAAKGDTKAIDALDEHLEYRMGKDGSFWQKQQVKTEVALGLVNLKGEAAIQYAGAAPKPDSPDPK